MNAGTSFSVAIEQAKANAQWTQSPRYVFWSGNGYYVEKDRPKGPMAHVYTKVTPDGKIVIEQPKLN